MKSREQVLRWKSAQGAVTSPLPPAGLDCLEPLRERRAHELGLKDALGPDSVFSVSFVRSRDYLLEGNVISLHLSFSECLLEA